MKLNLGCGSYYKKDYINIDRYSINFRVDRSFDCNNPLDYPDNSVEEILAIHLLEHLRITGLKRVIKSWFRCLKNDGKLILELPDLSKVAERFLQKEDEESLKYIFGSQDRLGQTHYWGWTPKTLQNFLKDIGFRSIKSMKAQDETRPKELCFRLEATK